MNSRIRGARAAGAVLGTITTVAFGGMAALGIAFFHQESATGSGTSSSPSATATPGTSDDSTGSAGSTGSGSVTGGPTADGGTGVSAGQGGGFQGRSSGS